MTQQRMDFFNATLLNISQPLALSRAPPPDDYYINKQYVKALQGGAVFMGLLIMIFAVNQYRWLKVLKLTGPKTDKNNVAMATGLQVDAMATELQVNELDKLLSVDTISEEMKSLLFKFLSLSDKREQLNSVV